MSTKAIREALELLGTFIKDTGGCDHAVNICVCGEGIVLCDAQAELEAIEKAALTLDVWSDEPVQERSVSMNRDAGEAFGLMAIIANQER